ncbi:NAD-dependent epimerase/dehydratase family protein [Flavobacteriaceae bacterium]|nr:NAD-dependent epimerase/dehydratase family protein [Flavobacteriaceae bacterium]
MQESKNKINILVTGAAGFIGFYLCQRLVIEGYKVIGLDNLNNYYDINLKFGRLEVLGFNKKKASSFNVLNDSDIYGDSLKFIRLNLEDRVELPKFFKINKINIICNLAAQAGVRYSISNPEKYIDSNVLGFANILECAKNNKIDKFIYASSSSVYGNNKVPFKESDNVDSPVSMYAATKKANELMAFVYSNLYQIQTIGLRFFTVYGPWGRPDMAPMLFSKAIMNDDTINVFNQGNLKRDFTYIDDVIEGLFRVVEKSNKNTYSIYNIGKGSPVKLLDFIKNIEIAFGKQVKKKFIDMQDGDVHETYSDTSKLKQDYNYMPSVDLKEGILKFINWYKNYY